VASFKIELDEVVFWM